MRSHTVTTSNIQLLSTSYVVSMTEELNLNCIFNLNINSDMLLVATLLDHKVEW